MEPHCRGRRWRLDKALACALQDSEVDLFAALDMKGLDKTSPGPFMVDIKWGDDGMGDVKLKKGTEANVPDKVIRCSFVVHAISAEVEGEDVVVWEDAGSGSSLNCRPLLIARGDEGSFPSSSTLLQPILAEMSDIVASKMTLETSFGHRIFSFNFTGCMFDEKRVRHIQGLAGSGSRFLCTLCDATRDVATSDPFDEVVTRSYDSHLSRYLKRKTNPDNLSTKDLGEVVKGQCGKPYDEAHLSPTMDALHCLINVGSRVIKTLYVYEFARVFTTKLSAKLMKPHKTNFDSVIRENLQIFTPLMPNGNYVRRLTEQKTVDFILGRVDNSRLESIRTFISTYNEMKAVYCSNQPLATCPELCARYSQNAQVLTALIDTHFTYLKPFSNYFHKMIAHVPELLDRDKSVGKFSSSSNERANKDSRQFTLRNSRQTSQFEMQDTLRIHWLYTSRRLQSAV
ncbi:V(D)J recombination-activating protein 1-like [Amphiura filiformis]|uniref:V(D)J recombination-activating protein 1-like n=1 Tax=Amphiura filiformis TaxID=82378 RepID=UPI003B224B13